MGRCIAPVHRFRASASWVVPGGLRSLTLPARSHKQGRPAYTLLEVLVASAVGVLLMGALYMAISVQLRHAQIGRDLVEESLLARALLTRIETDIRLSLGPPFPGGSSSSSAAGSSSTTGAGSSTGSGTTGATGTSSTASGSGATSSTSSSSATGSTAGGSGTAQVNYWVQGDTNWIMLYISRVPQPVHPIPGSVDPTQPLGFSDLRRISYWLAGGGDSPLGLARQELTAVTSPDAMAAVPPGIPDEESLVIAEEVKSLTFSYFDGTNWQDTWDGTVAGPDGSTPVGPPLAIAVTLGIAPAGVEGSSETNQGLKMYRHVVPILTANGTSQPNTSGTTTQ
jgi:type II secretory pathway pseudopilin PulG